MKKRLILSSIFTVLFIFLPPFLVNLEPKSDISNVQGISKEDNEATETNAAGEDSYTDVMTSFSSTTSFKKTYYISGSKVNVYKDNSGKDKVLRTLKENDVVVAYNENNGYVYCEDNNGNFGWIRKNTDNLSGEIEKNTKYKIDVDLTKQSINVFNNNNKIRQIICSTGKIGDSDTETPIGVFQVQNKGTFFFSPKYNEGGKYYIKFFSNYLIHSIPTDKNGNIIEEEKDKLGVPVSHGCIRVPVEDSKWLYDNIPVGTAVEIHY